MSCRIGAGIKSLREILLAVLIRKAASEVGSQIEFDRAVGRGWEQNSPTILIRQRPAFQTELDSLTMSAGGFLPVQTGPTEFGIGMKIDPELDFDSS